MLQSCFEKKKHGNTLKRATLAGRMDYDICPFFLDDFRVPRTLNKRIPSGQGRKSTALPCQMKGDCWPLGRELVRTYLLTDLIHRGDPRFVSPEPVGKSAMGAGAKLDGVYICFVIWSVANRDESAKPNSFENSWAKKNWNPKGGKLMESRFSCKPLRGTFECHRELVWRI